MVSVWTDLRIATTVAFNCDLGMSFYKSAIEQKLFIIMTSNLPTMMIVLYWHVHDCFFYFSPPSLISILVLRILLKSVFLQFLTSFLWITPMDGRIMTCGINCFLHDCKALISAWLLHDFFITSIMFMSHLWHHSA